MKHLAKTSAKHRSGISKRAIVIVSVVLLLVVVGTIAGFAALRDTAGTVSEQLTVADVTCSVNSDYSVTNTGNIPALIRVRPVIIVTDNNDIVPGETPEYSVGSDWTKIGDYLYCNAIISCEDGENTTSAALSFSSSVDDNIQIVLLAEAIQAASDAAEEAWGVTFSDGNWS